MGDQRFRIEILGTPGLFWRGETHKLPRRQARGLLFHLANTLQPVSRQQLCFLLWPDIPDSEARRNLSRLLSFLRAQLPAPELIFSNSEVVGLNSGKVCSDAVEFAQLAAQRLPEAKQAAVDLYRGDFLSGFSISKSPEYERWMSEVRSQYESLYLATLAELIKAKRAAHDLAAAIHYAQVYLGVDELAEEIHRILIGLHAESGDQVAAMRQYETCTLILERELGVEPLPETRAAYDAIRSDARQPTTQLKTQPTWTVLPSLDLPLIGRQRAWKDVETAYRQLQSGGVIFIRGEAGIGKSRLLREFATRSNRVVLSGNCYASTQNLPYQPLTHALRQALSQPRLWSGIRPIWLSEAGRILPEMGDFFPDLPAPIKVEPEQAQARLYEALAQCTLGIAANARTLFCLDDMQWADEATLGWLTYLSGRLAGSGICILATYRTAGESALSDLRESLKRSNLVAEVSLSGLSQEAILEIFAQLPDPPPQAVDLATRIKNATGGNPFFVLETLRIMLENDQLAAPPEMLPLAATVQEAILRRLDKLSPVARQVLEAAAVLAPELDHSLLQETAGRAEFEIVDGLDELARRQMLIEEEPPRLSHDLITQVAYQNLNPWRRRLLHRRAAESLHGLHKGQTDAVAAQIAEHYDAAGQVEKAVQYYYRAALVSRRIFAHEEVIDYLQRAFKLLSAAELTWHEMYEYYELLGESLTVTGKFEAARQVYNECLRHMPEDAYLHRVKCQVHLAGALANLYLLDQAEEVYHRALMILDAHSDDQVPTRQLVWLDIQLSRLAFYYQRARPGKMRALLEEIEPVIKMSGTPEQRAQFYVQQGGYALRQTRYVVSEGMISSVEAVLKARMEIGNPLGIASSKFRLGFVLLFSDLLEAAVPPLTQALEMAKEIGVLSLQLQCFVYLTCLYRLQRDLDGAETYAAQSLEIAQQLNAISYLGAAYGNLAWLDWVEHKFDQAEQRALEALSVWGDHPYPFKWLANWVLLAIYLDRDQLDKEIEIASSLLDPKQQRLPDDINAALERSVSSWEAEDSSTARVFLQKALELARKRGYL